MSIKAEIKGIGVYIPERKVTNDDVLEMLRNQSVGYLNNGDMEKILAKARYKLNKSGNDTRFWCGENEFCTDIAKKAAEEALQDAGIGAEEIDLIIFTGMSKAFVEPATAHVLRHEIGAINANVIDTQDACTSFMKSIELANSLIMTGSYNKILIAAGERTFDWADFTCKTVEELAWKFGSLTIGDAAGAMVLEGTEDSSYTEDYRHMNFFYRLADGDYSTCHIGLNHRIGDRYRLHSHSSRLIRLGLEKMMTLMIDLLATEKWHDFQYDTLLLHDIGKMIDEMIIPFLSQAKLCVPETYRSFFPQYGNVASVSLPLGMYLAKKDGRMKKGDIVCYFCPAAGVQAGIFVFKF